LSRSVGAPSALAEVGLPERALDEATALLVDSVPTDGPRPVSADDLAALLRAAWQGPPTQDGDQT
jgi:alcohol dehydrogenase class IV